MKRPVEITPELLRTLPLPEVGSETDKDQRGRVLSLAGSVEVPGAAILTSEAALRSGAGKLQIGAPAAVALALGLAVPEARVIALNGDALGPGVLRCVRHSDAVIMGPGWMDEAVAARRVRAAVARSRGAAFEIDAAALTGLARRPDTLEPLGGRVVLTPHCGEMASLLDRSKAEIEGDPVACATLAARRFGAVVVLKAAVTHIAAPSGEVWRHSGGVVGLATSGSGDVLAGVIGGLLARGAAPHVAAVWGVWLHGAAGRALTARIGPLGFLARELPAEIPRVLAGLPD